MDKIEERLEKAKVLPQEVKEKIDKIFFLNNVVAIIIMFYFAIINYSYYKMRTEDFINVMKFFALAMGIFSVIIFERSYRKDNLKITLVGIETLVCGIVASFIPYIYVYGQSIYRGFIMTIPIIFGAYYVLKTIISYVIRKRKHRAESITDIKEILSDKEEYKSYIDDKNSTKTIKKQKERERQEKEYRENKRKEKVSNVKIKSKRKKNKVNREVRKVKKKSKR